MNEPKPDDQAEVAWIILKRVYGNKPETLIYGDEGRVIELLASALYQNPDLLSIFERAHRYYRLHKNKMN